MPTLPQRLKSRAQVSRESCGFSQAQSARLCRASVEVKFGIRLLSPTFWRLTDLFAEGAHGDRDLAVAIRVDGYVVSYNGANIVQLASSQSPS